MMNRNLLFTVTLLAATLLGGEYASAAENMPDDPAAVGLTGEAYREYVMLQYDLGRLTRFQELADQAYDAESLILESDRDPLDILLRRTSALLEDIRNMPEASDLSTQASRLQQLIDQSRTIEVEDLDARARLFVE